MNLSLAPLRYIRATSMEGSFSGAARACGVSQPTVSNAVAQAEEQLGGQLFVRTTRTLSLTPFGEYVLPLINAIVEAEEELVREAAAYHDPPHKLIRIGFSPLLGGDLVVRLLQPFAAANPEVELVYKECGMGDMEARLDTHRIDVVFTAKFHKKSRRRSLLFHREPLHFVPRGGRGAAGPTKPTVSLQEAAQELLVLTGGDCGLAGVTRELFRKQGLAPTEYRGEALSYSVLEEWADLGIGAALLPASRLSQDAARFPVVVDAGVRVELEYRAVWNHDALRPAHLSAFVRYLKTSVSKLMRGDGIAAG